MTRQRPEVTDLVIAGVATLLAVIGIAAFDEGSGIRIALTGPFILLVPGYGLLQALIVPPTPWPQRGWHVAAAAAISIAVVGLTALLTTWGPGGITVTSIRWAVLAVTTALLLTAVWRRSLDARDVERADSPAAEPRRS